MALSKGNLSQLKSAFKSVYGNIDINEQTLVRYASEVLFHATKYPFEDEKLMSLRFSSIDDISDKEGIITYLAEIPKEEFSGTQMSTYGRLFELARKYDVLKIDGVEPINSTTKSVIIESNIKDFDEPTNVSDSVVDDVKMTDYNSGMEEKEIIPSETNPAASVSNIINETETINNTKFKEEIKMNAIEKLAQEAGSTGIGTNVGANVAEVSKNDRAAAKKLVEATQMDRMNYSKTTKITKVLVTKIEREKKAVNGRASMGHVSNPKKALDTFISKTGCTVEDGIVKFSKLHSSQLHDEAKKMYELLNQAVVDPNTEVAPYFGKEDAAVPVALKGIVIEDAQHKEITLAQKDIAAHILQHAFLYLDVNSKSHAQFQLDAATSRAGSAPKKSYVVRIANKTEMLEDESVCVYVKNITDKISESKTGFKSAMSVACNSNKLDANGNPKKITWRIPLEVEQYEVVVVDKYEDLFKSGVGNKVATINLASEKDVSDIVSKISTMIAAEASKAGGENIIGSELMAKLNEEKTAIVSADAEAVNATLGGGDVSDEDFEG